MKRETQNLQMQTREKQIREKIEAQLAPLYFEIENESHKHHRPEGAETHFRLVIVSEAFTGKSRVQKSQMVTDLLKDEFAAGLHALSQRAYSPQEWEEVKDDFKMKSPACLHRNKE